MLTELSSQKLMSVNSHFSYNSIYTAPMTSATQSCRKLLNVDEIKMLMTTWVNFGYAIRYVITLNYMTTLEHGHFTGNETEFELNSWELEHFSQGIFIGNFHRELSQGIFTGNFHLGIFFGCLKIDCDAEL